MSKKIIFLLFILIIASFLRLWQLGKVPISPDWDEVSLGYNTYSIINTAKDEYGKFLPIVLRSFDDYKPALYAYLTIPFIKIFGLEIFAVRLPSAIFGILTVLATFLLVKELFKRDSFAFISALLLAISPWHIQFSRIAFESNVGAALNVFAIFFFLKGLKKNWFLFLSSLIFGLNLYMYQSEKVFVPLLIVVLIFLFRKELSLIKKKYTFITLLIFLLTAFPLVSFTFTEKDALSRAKGVSIFSDSSLYTANARKLVQDIENNDLLGRILDNRRVEYVKNMTAGYLSHFDLNWLFITGDISRHHAPNMGLLYLWELPFLLIGIYSLLLGRFSKEFKAKEKSLIFVWFLLAPIPASITSGVPHAVRTLGLLPTLQIFTAIGIITFFYSVSKMYIKYLIYSVCFLFFIFNFSYYLDQYFIQQNYFTAYDWQYGYEKLIPTVSKVEGNYKKVIVSNEPPMDQSYMFFLFYLKYPPSLYQKEVQNASGGFKENHKFGKYEFRPFNWENEQKSKDVLYVGRPSDFSYKASVINTAFYPNGKPAMIVAY